MRTQRISVGFSKFSDANLLTKAQLILSKMTGNAYLDKPEPTLPVLEAALTAYSTALTNALKLGIDNVAEKNKARKALEAVLVALGLWVSFAANGNITIMLSSGFDVTKEPEPVHLPYPGNVTLSNGLTSGTLESKVKRLYGSTGFIHQLSSTLPDENTVWTSVSTSRSRYMHSSLKPGQQYWARVGVTGGNGQMLYSTVANAYVL